jgi:hypothetical protein
MRCSVAPVESAKNDHFLGGFVAFDLKLGNRALTFAGYLC